MSNHPLGSSRSDCIMLSLVTPCLKPRPQQERYQGGIRDATFSGNGTVVFPYANPEYLPAFIPPSYRQPFVVAIQAAPLNSMVDAIMVNLLDATPDRVDLIAHVIASQSAAASPALLLVNNSALGQAGPLR